MSDKSDAATTTEDIKMAPLCLFYFSHPFGILSPNPPSVTVAPDDYLPPTWMSSAFSEKSWNPISFSVKPSTEVDSDDTAKLPFKTANRYPVSQNVNKIHHRDAKKQEKFTHNPPTFKEDKKYSKTAGQRQSEQKKRDRFSGIEASRSDRVFAPLNVNQSVIQKQKANLGSLLPPIERFVKIEKQPEVVTTWPKADGVNKFRRRSLLPPIDMRRLNLIPPRKSPSESSQSESKTHNEDLSDQCGQSGRVEVKRTKRKSKTKSAKRKVRPIKSSRGVNKGRCAPNKSAARKLIAYLLQSVARGHRATTANLPSLSEVLKTVRQAWTSPKTLFSGITGETFNLEEKSGANMGLGQPLLPGASPGLMRRRYSLPETVMRKYKIAQQKSESEDSEAGSAPSVWVPSPARDRGGRGRERGPKSVLLRRLWGRDPPPPISGSHSELRYWDSRSGSSSPRSPERTCEACKRLSDKNLASSKSDTQSPPTHRKYANRSPKKQAFKCIGSSNHSPERTETIRTISPSTLIAGSTTSERSSFKSASISESSPKLGLSSLVTSSYPVTSEFSMTRSSASYSSDDASRSQSNPMLVRPMTASDSIKSSPTHKKRRQSISSLDSSAVDLKSKESGLSSLEKNSTQLPTTADSSSKATPQSYTSIQETTTTATSTSEAPTSETKKDSTSRSDSAMSSQTDNSTDFNKTSDNELSKSTSPSSAGKRSTPAANDKHVNHRTMSDTGISETIDYDSGKHSNSKEGSVTYSEDYSADVVTCLEKTEKSLPYIQQSLECLEVVVSETLNSTMFQEKNKQTVKSENLKSDLNFNNIDLIVSESSSRNTNRIDLDQYVSNILIDSLNTMTEQINEMNSNIDDDRKLNILEKEIKVKLQSVSASPINLITNPIITTLITSIPDKELLETTVIEEKMRSLAYTTGSKLFPLESSTVETRPMSTNYDEMRVSKDLKIIDESETVDESELESNMTQENNNVRTEEMYLNVGNTDTPLPYDVNDNENASVSFEDAKTKAVLRQLHRMFENNSNKNSLDLGHSNVDDNFNLCVEDAPKGYFCGNTNESTSHLEMSTDVDVFVDNSLNKIMSSIDINYNPEDLENSLNGNADSNTIETLGIPELHLKQGNNILSNVGAGSIYEKPPQRPLVVPRFSAIPHSASMEVNTSTDEEELDCQSDCMSLVDSLDDPNSPRFPFINEKAVKKGSKHDVKLVRGDIMTLLPENSTVASETKSPREKSEKFFIPIKEDSMEVIKENIVVAEHMPEKIREKLYQRQQKRELRKEHHKRKKMKQLKKELNRQKKVDGENTEEGVEVEQLDVNSKVENNKKSNSDVSKLKATSNGLDKRDKEMLNGKKSLPRLKKEDALKNIESFVIDKQGNFQSKGSTGKKPEKPKEKERPLKLQNRIENIKTDDSFLYKKNDANDTIEAVDTIKILKSKIDPEKCDRSSRPRRLYQKTEFQEGNKHVEILEIVECIESSPEPSDESQESTSDGKRPSNSKIPVLQKISRIKSLQKSGKGCRSPIGKGTPMNITVAKNDRDHYKNTNSKTDQLIANILIDAFNMDNLENSNVQLVLSPRDKKSILNQNLQSPPQISGGKRLSIPQQSVPSTIIPKYRRKFDAIPEEKSSASIESSNEEVSTKKSLDVKKSKNVESPKDSPKKESPNNKTPLRTIDENVKDNSLNVKSSPTKNENHDVSTSPIPQYISTATSPIPQNKIDLDVANHIKGKKALGTREGWAGFCRPQTRYSPENEGLHPSSNNPSDREAVGKIQCNNNTHATAPTSQRILRTMDSRDNIRQISIHHDALKSPDKTTDVINGSAKSTEEKSDDTKQKAKPSKKHKHDKTTLKSSENDSALSKSGERKRNINRDGVNSKTLMLPSPFKNQSYTQSEMSTSSGSDSEAGGNGPMLVPRWPPITAPRHRKVYSRRPQRQEEPYKMPYQNISGGWSVTLAGSCYTTLPSDVEMKVCFPKNVQQHTTSQSDSGLGEEQHYRKQPSAAPSNCKKCGNCENICQNCKTAPSCKCNALVNKEGNEDSENQAFLPSTHQSRKSSHNSKSENSESSKKYYHYLPDLNATHSLKNKKKPIVKMARRFSLHCWLPEDKVTDRPNMAKMEITETVLPVNEEELSVYGCAIMPELKPRVPTMSERDLTRVHTAQLYSRHRQI